MGFECIKTGVPFGDSVLVREFLHITSEVYLSLLVECLILSFSSLVDGVHLKGVRS